MGQGVMEEVGTEERDSWCSGWHSPCPVIRMLKRQRPHLEGVWVLVGVEQEAGADLLGAPGKDFQGPDDSPTPGLRVGKAAELTIADFFSCGERVACSGLTLELGAGTSLLLHLVTPLQVAASAPPVFSCPQCHLLVRDPSH